MSSIKIIKPFLKLCLVLLLFFSFLAPIFKLPSIFFSWYVWFFIFASINLSFLKNLRIVVFGLSIIWFYNLIGNSIPQQEFHQTTLLKVERNEYTFVKAGKKIFNGKGTCSACHSVDLSTESRCPDLLKGSREAKNRKKGMSAKEYLIESIYKPSEYIVEGYSAIMPEVWKPPISLTPLEIETVIAYIQSLSGDNLDITTFTPPVDLTEIDIEE